jgi:glycosyltransferase involved in cell wall biosynthesis
MNLSLPPRAIPFVSCICITQNRRLFLRQTVKYFERARSAWKASELFILDGSESSNAELRIDEGLYGDGRFLHEMGAVRYFHEPSPPGKMGARRNRACELARGDIILHWDDDDWQSPDRIVNQVQALTAMKVAERSEGAFAYTSQFYAYHLAERRAARWRSWGRGGSLGATFAYHRKLWEEKPFADVDQGEDNFFWDAHVARGACVDMADPSFMIYMRHNQNCSPFISEGATPADTNAARAIMARDLPFYDELSEILPQSQQHESRHERWRKTWEEQQMQRFAAMRKR